MSGVMVELHLWIVAFAAVFFFSFYYKVIVTSTAITRLYYVTLIKGSGPTLYYPTKIPKLLFFFLLVLGCLILSPLHIFVFIPGMLNLAKQSTERASFQPIEVLHDPGRATQVDVFAIHGLGSNPKSAWRGYSPNGTELYWLRDLLPNVDGMGEARVTMINHQTSYLEDAAVMEFEDHAKRLLDDIERVRQTHELRCRPIIFIAHSFGGLLLKQVTFYYQVLRILRDTNRLNRL
ncbi:hypothetical protein BDV38DRAFT_54715 [Aspergillus pseudotamarii]|uniref:DUF676 domain-containing protein n=1 Tax=Aspergillus pseudotamarii TaxID=132259 RepID=A0A5N6T0S7_ASPPS|nr:uncharacterized protein BDV38DRAFT_54715 [Aspergillus pseudotamarii]KAE8139194.1 hypothetical protein BDV38DRAFT_54715 [Aspergillus pseudotamarii]